MAENVHYTGERRKRAREANLVAFLESKGERVTLPYPLRPEEIATPFRIYAL